MNTSKEDYMTYTVVVISLLLNYGLGYLITEDWSWSIVFVLFTFWIFVPFVGVILSPLAVMIGLGSVEVKREPKAKETSYPLTDEEPTLSKRLRQDSYARNKKGTV